MEFKHIEYFIETAHHRSISQAAQSLYLTQQALSKTIANMEQELGIKLFDRSVKGITLTKEGKHVYNIFSKQVQTFRQSVNDLIDHYHSQPVKLSFCSSPLIFRCIDPDILFDFQEDFPNIILEQLDLPDEDCDHYVEEDPTHFGLIAIPENRHGERLNYSLVKTFPLYLFVNKNNPLSKLKVVNFSQLKNENFLMLDKKSYYRKVVRYYAHKHHFEPRVAYESSDANQLISFVNKNRGIALSLEPLLEKSVYENIVMVPFDDKTITWSIAFIYQDYDKLNANAKKFIEYLIDSIE